MCHHTKTASNGRDVSSLSIAYICPTFLYLCKFVTTALMLLLQVWGLFAPKFVFDVVGLILADILICLAWLYFVGRDKDGGSGSMPDRHD